MALSLIALGVFGSYFGIVISLFAFIARSLLAVKSTAKPKCRTRIWVFAALAFVSFLHTWYYMFAFMKWSFDDYEAWAATLDSSLVHRISSWTTNTALFEQAWATVCASAMNWWWSEQLCLFTAGAWTIFLYSESRRYGIPHAWAYMLLGQLVAISVASNLFYLAILLHAPLNATSSLGPYHAPLISVWWPVALSLRTIYNTPAVSGSPSFLSNLLIMHTLLVIPLLAKKPSPTSPISKWSSTKHLYTVIVAVSLYIRARTLLPLILLPTGAPIIIPSVEDIKALATNLIETLYSHPAQSSIGFDVVWTTISFLTWSLLFGPHERKGKGATKRIVLAVLMLAACLVLSVGVVAPAYLFFTVPVPVSAPPASPGAKATRGQGISSPGKTESKGEKGEVVIVPDISGARDAVDANNVAIVNEISDDI